MKTTFLTAVILCSLTGSVLAQKGSTFLGDIVIGEVVGTDEAAREITIKYPSKEGTEIFRGILVDGYKLKRSDGSVRELKISEITPGIRVRVFYKTDQETVSGQKKKIYKIFRIDFLGRDEYVRLREQLNVDPSTPIARAEYDGLPPMSPLKIYLAVAYAPVQQALVDWVNKWNKKYGETHGTLELVSKLANADISIVVSRGSDTMVAALPAEFYSEGGVVKGEWSQATSYLLIRDPEGLKVLWTTVAPVLTSEKIAVSPKSSEAIENEIEKRMKARKRK